MVTCAAVFAISGTSVTAVAPDPITSSFFGIRFGVSACL
ncbi:hypothetical protein GALL_516350 [mine drainage metagenome]|uniref:Uncharacterized protein n=1 Tax=mine drainage metagenome TaxID=410659 RepID=A0A1J5P5I0_9ZZZZ